MNYRLTLVLIAFSLIFLFTACNNTPPSSVPTLAGTAVLPQQTPANTAAIATQVPASPTATLIPPSPTPQLAALVNNEPIYLTTFEKELARYEQAQALSGTPTAESPNYRATVLDALIEQVLITQAAHQQGITVSEEELEIRLAELRSGAGEAGNFEAWLLANQYTEEEFRQALLASMLAERVVEKVTENVAETAEQVQARYIQLDDPALAQTVLEQAQAGSDFAFLAAQYSLDVATASNGGDLGYFSRGALLVPEVEEAAFALQPGELSPIVAVTDVASGKTTYYLVQLVARDPARPLDANMRYTLLDQTFQAWLQELWAQAQITRFVETGS